MSINTAKLFKPALTALMLSTALTTPTFAQESEVSEPVEAEVSAKFGVEEIIVTAERRSTSVQEVPASITAISGKDLVASGIQDTQDLVREVPGLIVQRSVVGKVSIRGVGNENYTISGDPGIAIHSDGVYIARASAGLFDLYDLERVEVLRGPQGTLYGRNATGGVINIIPAKPSEIFEGYIRGEYGNYDKVRLEGAISGPIIEDKLLFRGSGLMAKRDGYTRNIFPGAKARGLGDLDNQDLWSARGQLELRASDRVTARFSAEYVADDSNLPPYKYLNQPNALPGENYLLGQLRTVSQGYETAIPGASRGVGTDEDIFKTNQLGLALHLDVDLGNVALKSITGFRDTEFNWVNDGDGADIFYVNYIQQDKTKQYSQELQLASTGDDRFNWIVGGFAFRETGDSFIALPFTFGANLPFFIEMNGSAKTTAFAGFGEMSYRVTDDIKLTAGLRYSTEEREAIYEYEVNFGAPNISNVNAKDRYSALTPRFVIAWEPNPDLNVFASATRGFKSGGFNLLAVQPGFEPEKVWSYEGGVKARLDGGRATINANLFYTEYSNQQVGQIVNLSSVLTNAAASTLYGAEIEFQARPSENFRVGATFAYLNAKYDDFCTGDPTRPAAPVSPGCDAANPIQLQGNTLPRAPEFAITADAAYTIPLSGNGSALEIAGDVRFQSDTFFTQFNRPEISQDGYAIANARLRYIGPDERFTVGLWVKNLFDKNYFTEVLESGAFNPQLVAQAYVAPPRTFGISAGFSF